MCFLALSCGWSEAATHHPLLFWFLGGLFALSSSLFSFSLFVLLFHLFLILLHVFDVPTGKTSSY